VAADGPNPAPADKPAEPAPAAAVSRSGFDLTSRRCRLHALVGFGKFVSGVNDSSSTSSATGDFPPRRSPAPKTPDEDGRTARPQIARMGHDRFLWNTSSKTKGRNGAIHYFDVTRVRPLRARPFTHHRGKVCDARRARSHQNDADGTTRARFSSLTDSFQHTGVADVELSHSLVIDRRESTRWDA